MHIITIDEVINYLEGYSKESLGLMNTKGRDYAPEGKALVDVFEVSRQMKITPAQVLYVYRMKQETAIRRYIMTGSLDSEGFVSRTVDTVNFTWLLRVVEEKEVKERALRCAS